jgi:hypothetical protein
MIFRSRGCVLLSEELTFQVPPCYLLASNYCAEMPKALLSAGSGDRLKIVVGLNKYKYLIRMSGLVAFTVLLNL